MKCSQCGAELNGNKFCSNCGAPASQSDAYAEQLISQQNRKKPISGGKIALIVVSIVVGLMIIFGTIIGVVACNFVKDVKSAVSTYDDSLSNTTGNLSGYLDSSGSEPESQDSDKSSLEIISDSETGFDFKRSVLYDGWAVAGYDKTDFESSEFTLEVPEQFMGENVVEIQGLYMYDMAFSENQYIKVIIPGTVKVIDTNSITGDTDELVIKDGVTKIGIDAFSAEHLRKIHIPASVTSIPDDCGLSDYAKYNDDGFTLYCAKNSEAENYAKKHNLNYEIED